MTAFGAARALSWMGGAAGRARRSAGLGAALLLAALGGCGDEIVPLRPDAAAEDLEDGGPEPLDAGPPDAGTRFGCPILRDPQASAGDDLGGDSWETFARGFFESYCTRCHASSLATREQRNNAPAGYDWDDEASVRAHLAEIRGAVGVLNFMPPSDPSPGCDERLRLVRWIDAGAP